MRVVRSIAEIRAAVAGHRAEGRTIGLVPTMGAFHDGHLALMHAARQRCDTVVVSLFVNPTQFNEASDLAAYPRDEARDASLAREEGVDLMWAPERRAHVPRRVRDHRQRRRPRRADWRAPTAGPSTSAASRPSSSSCSTSSAPTSPSSARRTPSRWR